MRILLVEDDAALAVELAHLLRGAGFAVDVAGDGLDAWHLGDIDPYDAAVLDLGLPGIPGMTVLERWRAAGRTFPVLILTARNTWDDKARAFAGGGDDYLTKPFLPDEVLVRLRALIRRARGHSGSRISCGPLTFDTHGGTFEIDGAALELTAFEWRLLSALMLRKNAVVPRADLAEAAYEHGHDVDFASLEVVIGRLRRKIGADLIRTVRGMGYQLAEPTR